MKKYLLGTIAIILAISFSSFTHPKEESTNVSGELWYHFDGTAPTDLMNASKYSLDGDGSSATVCASISKPNRCEIKAQPQSGNPNLPNLATIVGQTKRDNP